MIVIGGDHSFTTIAAKVFHLLTYDKRSPLCRCGLAVKFVWNLDGNYRGWLVVV